MALFDNSNIKLDVLKKRAFNYRWAEVPDGVIPLTAADPDYPVAPEIQEAMMDYVKDGYFSYTPKLGYPEFKDSISKALMERKGEEIDPELILPIDSAARGMYVIAQTVLRQGDEMIVFDPVDYLFRESCLAAGGKVVLFPAKLKDGYIDLSELENYITPKTRMIGLCNPHNPYGVVYRPEDLEHIMSLCEKYNLYIMNDEIWSDIILDGHKHIPTQSVSEDAKNRTIAVYAPSKTFNLAGLIGSYHIIYNKYLRDRVIKQSELSHYNSMNVLSMYALIGAYKTEGYEWTDELRTVITKNVNYAYDFITRNFKGVKLAKPEGTYMLYLDCGEWCREHGMTMDELIKAGIAVGVVWQDGRPFNNPSAIRMNLAVPYSLVVEAFDRLDKHVFNKM